MSTFLKNLAVKSVKFYRFLISPYLASCFGQSCRFWPSCSEYSLLAFDKYGVKKGFWLTLKRIFKCHPWHQGGIDLP